MEAHGVRQRSSPNGRGNEVSDEARVLIAVLIAVVAIVSLALLGDRLSELAKLERCKLYPSEACCK